MYTPRPLYHDIHEPVLVVTDSLYIKGMPTFPVYVVHGVGRWLLYFNVRAVDRSQTLWHAMSMMEAPNKILSLRLRKAQLNVFWTEMDSDRFTGLSDNDTTCRDTPNTLVAFRSCPLSHK